MGIDRGKDITKLNKAKNKVHLSLKKPKQRIINQTEVNKTKVITKNQNKENQTKLSRKTTTRCYKPKSSEKN